MLGSVLSSLPPSPIYQVDISGLQVRGPRCREAEERGSRWSGRDRNSGDLTLVHLHSSVQMMLLL